MRPGISFCCAIVLASALACDRDPTGPESGASPNDPNVPDTVWLDRPDRSGRLTFPLLRGHDWQYTPVLVVPTVKPAGFVSVEPISDSIYPGYPLDPNSFRLARDPAGVGLVYAGEDSVVVIAPIAVDDTARVEAGETVSIPVTFNDRATPGQGSAITVAEIIPPGHGNVSATPDGQSIAYAPQAGFAGTDTLKYVALDAVSGARDTALVRVFVGPGRYAVVDLQPVGSAIEINDIAGGGWAVGTATMAHGRTRAVRWRNGVAELLPIGRGTASRGERISDHGAVYGSIDDAPSYWRSAGAAPVKIEASVIYDMNGRGDLLLGRLVDGCLAATIWFPAGTIEVPAQATKNCDRTLRGLDDARDVLWVNATASAKIAVIQDSTGAMSIGPSTSAAGDWVAFNRSLTVIGRTARSSSLVPGYDGPAMWGMTGMDFPATYGGSGLTELVDVNDNGWVVAIEDGKPILLIGGGRFRINEVVEPRWLQFRAVTRIVNDGSLLGVLPSGERKVLRLR